MIAPNLRDKPGHVQNVVLKIVILEQLIVSVVSEPRRQQVYIKRTAKPAVDFHPAMNLLHGCLHAVLRLQIVAKVRRRR